MSRTTALKPRRVQHAMSAAALMATFLLTACAQSAPFSFYTLVGPVATQPAAARTPLLIEVLPSTVPTQVQRPQLVLTTAPGQIKIMEQQRWSQPVADEISQALSQDLTRRLPAVDVYRSAHSDAQAVYRVALNVQRFESVPGNRATLDAVWSVTVNPRGLVMTCHSIMNQPVAAGLAGTDPDYAALVDAHRQAIQQLSGEIASAIGQLAALPPGSTHAGTSAASPNPGLACPGTP